MIIKRGNTTFKAIVCSIVLTFVMTLMCADLFRVNNSIAAQLHLPAPTQLLKISDDVVTPMLRGLKIDYQNPLEFKFIFDTGDDKNVTEKDTKRIINYFFATLALPNSALWVNLSPYEQQRVVDEELGQTELGRDLLGQDYMLKQLSSSLTHPSTVSGKSYWSFLQDSTEESFNKIWIAPEVESIQIREKDGVVWIAESRLEALTESDYLARNVNNSSVSQDVTNDAIESVLLPKIKSQLNDGEHFSQLRQIFNAMILGMWFKKKFRQSFFSQYFDKQNVKGIDLEDKKVKEKLFELYKQSFDKKVYDLIKKERNKQTKKVVNRRYFSGGFSSSSIVGASGELVIDSYEPDDIADVFSNVKGRLKVVATYLKKFIRGAEYTKNENLSAFEMADDNQKRHERIELMRQLNQLFPEEPGNDKNRKEKQERDEREQLKKEIIQMLGNQFSKVSQMSVLAPDAGHLLRTLENAKKLFHENSILRTGIENEFGKENALSILSLSVILSKIGFGHENIDPLDRQTYKENRDNAAEMLAPIEWRISRMFGLTHQKMSKVVEAIYMQGSYGIGNAFNYGQGNNGEKFKNPLTALMTLASEFDITRHRLQKWQTYKPLLKILLRVASDPEVLMYYGRMTQIKEEGSELKERKASEDDVASNERERVEYGNAFDKRLSEIFIREIDANKEKIIRQLLQMDNSPESALYIFDKFRATLKGDSSESYLWFISTYGLESINVEDNNIEFGYRVDEMPALGAAGSLTNVQNFHEQRLRRIITQINAVQQTGFNVTSAEKRKNPKMYKRIREAKKAETHAHMKMSVDFEIKIWNQLILNFGNDTARREERDTILSKSQDHLNNLRRRYYKERNLPQPDMEIDLVMMFQTANEIVDDLFDFTRNRFVGLANTLSSNKDYIAQDAIDLVNLAEILQSHGRGNFLQNRMDSELGRVYKRLTPESQAWVETVSEEERNRIRMKIASYHRMKHAVFDIFNFQDGGLEDFVLSFMSTSALFKLSKEQGDAADRRITKSALAQYQEDNVSYAELRFNISQSGDPEKSVQKTRDEIVNTILAHKEYVREQENVGQATDAPELKLILSITKFNDYGKPESERKAHKVGSVETFVEILRQAMDAGDNRLVEGADVTGNDILSYVVGIDAAGQEEYNNPSLFFDAYEVIEKFKLEMIQRGYNPVGTTFHVAESIRDVRAESGLRYAFEGLFMKSIGDVDLDKDKPALDRLGHAIMLGIDYSRLVGTQRQERISERIEQIKFDLVLIDRGIPFIGITKEGLEKELLELEDRFESEPDAILSYEYKRNDAVDLETRSGFILDLLIKHGTVIETNPTSNVGIAEHFDGYSDHTLKRFLDYEYGDWTKALASRTVFDAESYLDRLLLGTKVKVSVSTDDLTLFGTTLTEELYRMAIALDLSKKQVTELLRNGFQSRFSEKRKASSDIDSDNEDGLGGIDMQDLESQVSVDKNQESLFFVDFSISESFFDNGIDYTITSSKLVTEEEII